VVAQGLVRFNSLPVVARSCTRH